MASALIFVLAPETQLPVDGASWSELMQAQSLRSGINLRIFPVLPDNQDSLDLLISRGSAAVGGANPFGSKQGRALCDALVPHIDPRTLGIGVYEISDSPDPSVAVNAGHRKVDSAELSDVRHPASGLPIRSIRCLDRFALRDAENETCWFYPTEPGTYLSWENRCRLRTEPGFLPEIPPQDNPSEYRRDHIHVLWSLMADDRALTCVGLTYAKRRIEWPLLRSEAEECATWTAFRIDPMAEESFEELSCISVFGADRAP